ncbi:uncharacterized protein LOC117528585 isoform X2 [Thalassophryne amazonica]|uniref:uncharacterized protein LOC117528585 isoform X2 n=1 Tax=Thalassophryne amazonica TaxID=390379 RepID=UPI0014715705|nr:uncharacterized protein LOC117528585 isoform X2 [Thalassophryne amazonica]
MTSWSLLSLMFFYVFQGSIDLSVGNCVNYLLDKEWMENPEKDGGKIYLVNHNREHTVDCSIEREWNKTNNIHLQNILNDCFNRQESVNPTLVSQAHFNCMIAKAKNLTNKVKECEELETVCKFILEPTWTASTTTSKQLTTTQHGLRTTTTPSTTATTVTSPTNSTDKEIDQDIHFSKGQIRGKAPDGTPECRQQEAGGVPVLAHILVISVVLNVFLSLAVYFFMCHTLRCDCKHKSHETVSINHTSCSYRPEDCHSPKIPDYRTTGV